MTRRIRIPGLLDVVMLDEPSAIAAVSEDTRLDRDFSGAGPLLNRWITRRVRRVLRAGNTPLPSVAPRADRRRAERQADLAAALDRVLAAGVPAPGHLDRLAAYVRGGTDEAALGPLVQEAVGRLFAIDYRADAGTWQAACLLDAAPRNRNPLRALRWALTGAVGRARRVLTGAVRNDAAGVHATAIAVHTLVRSVEAMRALWRDPETRGRLSTEHAVCRALRAPETVLRQWTAPAVTADGAVSRGTLAVFELDAARRRDIRPETVFLSASWSRCPAANWTAALLRNVWERAKSAEELNLAPGPATDEGRVARASRSTT